MFTPIIGRMVDGEETYLDVSLPLDMPDFTPEEEAELETLLSDFITRVMARATSK